MMDDTYCHACLTCNNAELACGAPVWVHACVGLVALTPSR